MSLSERMKSKIIPAVKAELGLKNDMAVPRIKMVKVQVGIGSMVTRKSADTKPVLENVAKITGQKPIITKSKKAISNFKLREGLAVGVVSTLRGKRALDFIDRLVTFVIPRVRDFRGLSPKAFDGHGNYSLGFKESVVFPEVNPDEASSVHGLQVTIVTSAKDDAQGLSLLKNIGFPFKKD